MTVSRLSAPLNTHDAIDGSGLKILDDCLGYSVSGNEYWVERGFKTDFASIPPFARIIVRWNKVDDAAVIHDKPFSDGYIYDRYGQRRAVSLWEINRVFRKIAQYGSNPSGNWFKDTWRSKDRANPFQAWATWTGLFLGGWWKWRKRPIVDTSIQSVPNPLNCKK